MRSLRNEAGLISSGNSRRVAGTTEPGDGSQLSLQQVAKDPEISHPSLFGLHCVCQHNQPWEQNSQTYIRKHNSNLSEINFLFPRTRVVTRTLSL
jgi:hypothetical protein